MKKMLVISVAIWFVLGFALSAHALLIDRGGGMIYSTDMDITILQDANYAMTSGYDDDGYMTWTVANTWVQNLDYGGYDDWRLPTFDPDYNREDVAAYPSEAAEYSELAYLRYAALEPDVSVYDFDPTPFINLGGSGEIWIEPWYWSGTLDASSLEYDAWRFDFSCG